MKKAKDTNKVAAQPSAIPAPSMVVAIGASAGGLDSISELLRHLSATIGFAFVIVQHMEPGKENLLAPLLARVTPMTVVQVKNKTLLEPDHIYINTPEFEVSSKGGQLQFTHVTRSPDRRSIDNFFKAIALQLGPRSIGIVLSGTGNDGTQGLKAIHNEGGLTFAEDLKSAKFLDMPASAAAQGFVDFVMPPQGIAHELGRLASHPFVSVSLDGNLDQDGQGLATATQAEQEEVLPAIFAVLRDAMGVDFAQYKPSTVRRRIMRRLMLQHMDTLEPYLELLRANPDEVVSLYQDLLITVTGLFRDPEVYEALAQTVFPQMLEKITTDRPIRLWVPGCSRGDEVYSLAITLLEVMRDMKRHQAVQIFGTDVNEHAVDTARAAVYPETLGEQVSKERLRRYFQKVDRGYVINKSIRDLCVFARQDLTRDPPFSRLDLISCRNVLIYLNPALQSKILRVFHYALKPGGVLLLGTSESIGRASELFSQQDRKLKIYQRQGSHTSMNFDFDATQLPPRQEAGRIVVPRPAPPGATPDAVKEADRFVLGRYAPPGVVLTESFEVVQFRGRTGLFLEPPAGQTTNNILRMAREGLLADLRSALQEAGANDTPALRENVKVRTNGGYSDVNLVVVPLKAPGWRDRHYLVLFNPHSSPPHQETRPPSGQEQEEELFLLRQELAATREYLNSSNQEQEGTLEVLQAANEEIQSANEELQSTNEELETAKEELQSTNEELTTVNEELHERNLEMTRANNDLNNLLSSVNIPVVILGSDMRIRRFTPMAKNILRVIPSDVGRPIGDLRPNIDIPDLERRIMEVVDHLCPQELELQDRQGCWYSVRIRPYRTSENQIDGAVIVFVDIDQFKRSLEKAKEAQDIAQTLIELLPQAAVVVDRELKLRQCNGKFLRQFGTSHRSADGSNLLEMLARDWDGFPIAESLTAVDKGETVTLSLTSVVDPRVSKQGAQALLKASIRKIETEGAKFVYLILLGQPTSE